MIDYIISQGTYLFYKATTGHTYKHRVSNPSRPTASLFGLRDKIDVTIFSNVSVTL